MSDVWSREDLIKMLLNQEVDSRKLYMENETEILRTKLGDSICIEKKSKNNQRALYEQSFIINLEMLDDVKCHIAEQVKLERNGDSSTIYTVWYGFDLADWRKILEEKNPFATSLNNILLLLKHILLMVEKFHARGMVHNDLHEKNIILPFEYDKNKNIGKLKLLDLRMIDFEFSLYPRSSDTLLPARTQAKWFDEKGIPVKFNPEWHSPNICPWEVTRIFFPDTINSKIKGCYKNQYIRTGDGSLIPKTAPFDSLCKIDFGSDFFSLAILVEKYLSNAAWYLSSDELNLNSKAYSYLLDLPTELKRYDVLVDELRPIPHRKFIKEIDEILGDKLLDSIEFNLDNTGIFLNKNIYLNDKESNKSFISKIPPRKKHGSRFIDGGDVTKFPEMTCVQQGIYKIAATIEAEQANISYELSTPLAVGVFPITVAQYSNLMKMYVMKENLYDENADYSYFPVTNVSWFDANNYCNKLNEIVSIFRKSANLPQLPSKCKYRLPTVQEWELFARAGGAKNFSLSPLYFPPLGYTDSPDPECAHYDWRLSYKRSSIKSEWPEYLAKVNMYEPNAWNIYGCHGNVGEWVDSPTTDEEAFLCGGHFRSAPDDIRCSAKVKRGKSYNVGGVTGFRVVRNIDNSEWEI